MDYRSSTSNFFASPLEGHVDLNVCLGNCHQIAQDSQYISFIISVVLRCGDTKLVSEGLYRQDDSCGMFE